MNYQRLAEKAEKFVANYFKDHPCPALLYHNIEHTRYVVKAAIKIAGFSGLNDPDVFALTIAAWFHDIGYVESEQDHELAGAQLAENFLEKHEAGPPFIEQVRALILATDRKRAPANLPEQIICDADIYHTGQDSFAKKSEALRKETELLNHQELDKIIWLKQTISFLESQQFNTIYCKQSLQEKKEENLSKMKTRLLKLTDPPYNVLEHVDLKLDKASIKMKDKEKGIDTMFRIASSNSQRMSSMADHKAHILITVNSIILSVILSLLLRKLTENAYLMIPTFLLLGVNLSTMIFAILSTRPALPGRTFYLKTWELEKVNLLFFGNFYHMGLEEYNKGMHLMMDDPEVLYNTLIEDVYMRGKFLGKKYHLLRIAYNIFMFGLVLAVLTFAIASVIHGPQTTFSAIKLFKK